MKLADLKKKSTTDLDKLMAEHRSRLQELSFKLNANQVKNVREVRVVKKEIARILTLKNAAK